MLAGFRVEGDIAGAGFGKHADQFIHRADHQVHVDGGGDAVVAQGLADHGADGQVGHVMVVHHVEMDHIGAGRQHRVALFPKTGKVGGKDGGGDQIVLLGHGASSV